MAKYLDYDGLNRFLTKVKALITAGDSAVDTKVTNLETRVENKLEYVFSLNDETKRITANTDLNSYKKPGVYVCTSNATASSLSNCPVSVAFVMVVQSVYGYYATGGNWNNLVREISCYDQVGFYRQNVSSGGNNDYTFGTWRPFLESAIYNVTESVLTMRSGYTLVQGKLYRQGKRYFGDLVVKKNSGSFSNESDEIVADLSVTPIHDINSFCVGADSQWSAQAVGYLYYGSTVHICMVATGKNYAKFHLDFPVE